MTAITTMTNFREKNAITMVITKMTNFREQNAITMVITKMRNQNDCFRTASEGTVEDCFFKNSVRQRVKIKKKRF